MEGNPGDVAITKEPATQALNSEMQEEGTVTQEPVSLKAIELTAKESLKDVAVTQEPATQELMSEENPGDVAATKEPVTRELYSEMQVDQREDTVTQEPVSQQALNTAMEGNPGDVAATQEPATQE